MLITHQFSYQFDVSIENLSRHSAPWYYMKPYYFIGNFSDFVCWCCCCVCFFVDFFIDFLCILIPLFVIFFSFSIDWLCGAFSPPLFIWSSSIHLFRYVFFNVVLCYVSDYIGIIVLLLSLSNTISISRWFYHLLGFNLFTRLVNQLVICMRMNKSQKKHRRTKSKWCPLQ